MCATTSTANQIASPHAGKLQRAKPESKIKAGLTYYWLNKAKNYSKMSSSKIADILDDQKSPNDLINNRIENRKMQFARYANGDSSMSYTELKKFVERCRENNLLPPPLPKSTGCGLGYYDIKECILEAPDPENAVKEITEFRKQFEEKRAALVKSLIEYSKAIEAADSVKFLVLDMASEIPGDDVEAGYIENVHGSQLIQFAEAVKNHNLVTNID